MNDFTSSFEALRRRWPAITAAAEHPLTEALAQRHSARNWLLTEFLDLLLVVLIYIFICLFVSTRLDWSLKIITLFVYLFGVYAHSRLRKSVDYGLARIIARRDAGQLSDLRMTPLTFRQIVAIHAVSQFLRPAPLIFPVLRMLAFMAFIIFYLETYGAQFRFFNLEVPYRVLVYLAIGLLFASGYRLRREIRMRQALRAVWSSVVPKTELFIPGTGRIKYFALVMFVYTLLFVLLVTSSNLSPTSYLLMLFCFIAVFILVILPFEHSPARTEKLFADIVQRAGRYYLQLPEMH